MSTDVMSRGIIIPLRSKIKDPSEFNEKLWEADSLLRVNYEGSFIYSDEGGRGNDAYGLFFDRPNPTGAMMNEIRTLGLSVVTAQARSYACLWYNGADNPVDDMTKAQFLERTGQANA